MMHLTLILCDTLLVATQDEDNNWNVTVADNVTGKNRKAKWTQLQFTLALHRDDDDEGLTAKLYEIAVQRLAEGSPSDPLIQRSQTGASRNAECITMEQSMYRIDTAIKWLVAKASEYGVVEWQRGVDPVANWCDHLPANRGGIGNASLLDSACEGVRRS